MWACCPTENTSSRRLAPDAMSRRECASSFSPSVSRADAAVSPHAPAQAVLRNQMLNHCCAEEKHHHTYLWLQSCSDHTHCSAPDKGMSCSDEAQ